MILTPKILLTVRLKAQSPNHEKSEGIEAPNLQAQILERSSKFQGSL